MWGSVLQVLSGIGRFSLPLRALKALGLGANLNLLEAKELEDSGG